jgi:hypothetical protein
MPIVSLYVFWQTISKCSNARAAAHLVPSYCHGTGQTNTGIKAHIVINKQEDDLR